MSQVSQPGQHTVGALLAGGASRRMGKDKATVDLGGRPLFRWAADALAWTDEQVQSGGAALPGLGWRVLPDAHPDTGPAGALLTVLEAYPDRVVVVCAVDLPFAGAELLRATARLAGHAPRGAGVAAVVPRHRDRWQPLAGSWRPEAGEPLRSWLAAGRRDFQGLLDQLAVRIFSRPEVQEIGDPGTLLLNVNSPDDLERAREVATHLAR